MRRLVAWLTVLVNFVFVVPTAVAQADYPSQPLRFYVGFPPGGSTDLLARMLAPELGKRLGQPVIVDNKSGAAGVIGVDTVAKAAPDGHTLGIGISGALTTNVVLRSDLPYDPRKDLEPVSMLAMLPLVVTVPSSLGADSLQAFISLAKKSGKFTYGTAGTGTVMNLAGELLKQTAGFDMVQAGYKGSGPAALDLLGGRLQAAILELAVAKPHVQSGKLRALAITSHRRTPLAPEIPTIAEAGVPGYQLGLEAWFGVVMPAGTPPAIVSQVNAALVSALNDPAVNAKLLELGLEPAPSTPEQFKQTIRSDIARAEKLIKASGLKAQ